MSELIHLAASYQAMRDPNREQETVLATAMADRTTWDQPTRQQRYLPVAAAAELRRRHPDQPWPRYAPPGPSPPPTPSTKARLQPQGRTSRR